MKARHAFPRKIPIMHGRGYPIKSRDKILKALKTAKKWYQKKAKDGPLKMFLMMPDPHGSGKCQLAKNKELSIPPIWGC